MPRRDPHQVLGVSPGASGATIKAAWRRLARENHPDLTTGDAGAARAATRRMAEINAAYEELRVGGRSAAGTGTAARGTGQAGRGGAGARAGSNGAETDHETGGNGTGRERAEQEAAAAQSGRARRPVTGRVDTSHTFRPRNQTTTRAHPPASAWRAGPPPGPVAGGREPLRASDPTGPLRRSRVERFRPPRPPRLEDAQARPIAFGKFHGHTLGEIAAFEPSYIDWLATTITRDRELVAAARVIQADLDARGVVRRRHPSRPEPRPVD